MDQYSYKAADSRWVLHILYTHPNSKGKPCAKFSEIFSTLLVPFTFVASIYSQNLKAKMDGVLPLELLKMSCSLPDREAPQGMLSLYCISESGLT